MVASLGLAGCGTTDLPEFQPTPVEYKVIVPYECGAPETSTKFEAQEVNWMALDDFELGRIYVLTAEDFAKHQENMGNVLLAGSEFKGQRDFYQNCIERSKDEVVQ